MTACGRIRRQLAVSRREWSAAEREQVNMHLRSCTECAAVAEEWASQERLLSTLPRHSMSPERQRELLAQACREGKGLRVRLARGLSTAAGVLIPVLVTVAIAVLLRHLASWQGESMTITPVQPAAPVAPRVWAERQMALTSAVDMLWAVASSFVPGLMLAGFIAVMVRLLWQRRSTLRRSVGTLLSLSGPVLLTTAHLLSVGAMISFGARTRGYPLQLAGLAIYGSAVVLSVAAMGMLTWRMGHTGVDVLNLLLISAPAFASLTLRAGLWMGGAPYAPYDPGDTDIFTFFTLVFVILGIVVSTVYGSFRYLAVTCAVQLILGFVTYVFPRCRSYGRECVWIWSTTQLGLMVPYLAGAVLIGWRNALLKRQRPGLWVAAALTGLVGAWNLNRILGWLPQNGAYLGWWAEGFYVPDGAWDWARSAAQFAAIAAMVVAVLGGILALWSRRRREPVLVQGAGDTSAGDEH